MLAVPATTAHASSVAMNEYHGHNNPKYLAGPGEFNVVTFARLQEDPPSPYRSTIVITDVGASISSGDNCKTTARSIAVCDDFSFTLGVGLGGSFFTFEVYLGDLADTFVAARGSSEGGDLYWGVAVNGGVGNDVLVGAEGRDLFIPGAGNDTLNSGGGDDLVNSRDGQKDRVNCGVGNDRAKIDPIDDVSNCEQFLP